jgi:hypothetical protein
MKSLTLPGRRVLRSKSNHDECEFEVLRENKKEKRIGGGGK